MEGTGSDDYPGPGDPAFRQGPALSNISSLPVGVDGEGVLQGFPTGEAWSDENAARFEIALDPAPSGIADRSTVMVAFDHTTQIYRSGTRLGDPLTALNSENGSHDADPTSAGKVTVRFHIKDGRPFADRIELTDEFPDD